MRRIGPSTSSRGSASPTVSPVRGERLKAEYTGTPSRVSVIQLPSVSRPVISTKALPAAVPT